MCANQEPKPHSRTVTDTQVPPVERYPRRVLGGSQSRGPIVSHQMCCSPLALWRVHKGPVGGLAATSFWLELFPASPPPFKFVLILLKLHITFFFSLFGKSRIVASDKVVLISRFWVDVKGGILSFGGVKRALKCCFHRRRDRVLTLQSTPSIKAALPEIVVDLFGKLRSGHLQGFDVLLLSLCVV